jgi:hypothetical protein
VYLRQERAFLLIGSAVPVGRWRRSFNQRGRPVDLTPGEKAVLGQIRVLYYNRAQRDHQVKALLMLWPPTHHQAYESAFAGLVAKQLIGRRDAQFFRINDAGLRVMGIKMPQPPRQQVNAAGRQQALPPGSQPVQVMKQPPGPMSKLRGALSLLGVLRART